MPLTMFSFTFVALMAKAAAGCGGGACSGRKGQRTESARRAKGGEPAGETPEREETRQIRAHNATFANALRLQTWSPKTAEEEKRERG